MSVALSVIGCAANDDMSDLPSTEQIALASEPDQFSATMSIADASGAPLKPVHANLMPDGRVLLIGSEGNAGLLAPSAAIAPVTLAAATPPVEVSFQVFEDRYVVADLLFCSGHTQLADGSFFSVGGTRWILDQQTQFHYLMGLGYGTRFDGAAWTRPAGRMTIPGPGGDAIRWYPQATRLPDGKVLVTSGYDMPLYGPEGGPDVPGTRNVSAELYDPATGTFSALTNAAQTPVAIFNPDYSHLFVLPYPGVVDAYALGESSAPVLFGTALPGTWSVRLVPRPGTTLFGDGTARIVSPNYGASSAMLPIRVQNGQWGYFNGAALVAGGAYNTANEHSIDVYDPIANAWGARRDMEVRRHHPSTVVLPDGRILVIAGHDDSLTSGVRIRKATYVDPALGFQITEGQNAMDETRGYHTVTLLLPDGRVLIGGGRDAGANSTANEKSTFRYYSPGYLTRPRPALTRLAGQVPSAASAVRYGQAYTIQFTGQVTEAVLIGLGSMTHSFDSNQRYVQLGMTPTGAGTAVIAGPPNPETAPPGYYMLFLVAQDRTPSVAAIVRVY